MPAAVDYQALFRALPETFALMAPDGKILDTTDQHQAVSFLPREQAVGRDMFEAYPSAPESQRLLRASQDYVRAHQQPHTMDLLRYDLMRPDGSAAVDYWEATHYPLFDEVGKLQYILQRSQNVTARVLAEHERARAAAALTEQRDFNQFVLDALPLIIWTSRPGGGTTYLNHGWYAFTGQDATVDPATLDTTALIHPADLPGVTAAWQRAAETGTACQFEYRLRRHDGEYRWLLGRVAPRHDAATGQLTLWAGCATDIHQQRTLVQELESAAEEQLTLAEQAYQASRDAQHQRDTFYGLFQQAPAMICVLRGPEHRYEFVNPIYQSVFPGRQLLGRTVAEALPEVVDQGIIGLLDGVYQSGQPFYGNELLIAFADDQGSREEKFFNFIYQQFRETDGSVAGILVFAFEVTELVRARQRLERLTDPSAPAQA